MSSFLNNDYETNTTYCGSRRFKRKAPTCTYKEAVERLRLPTYSSYEHLITAVQCHLKVQQYEEADKPTRLNKVSNLYGKSRAIELYYDDLLCVYDDDDLDSTVRTVTSGHHSPCGLMNPTPCEISESQLWYMNIVTQSLDPTQQSELPVSLSEENYALLLAVDDSVRRTSLVYFLAYNEKTHESRYLLCPTCAGVHSQQIFCDNQMEHHCLRYHYRDAEEVIKELGPSMWKRNDKAEKEFVLLVDAYNEVYKLSTMQCAAALDINRAAGNSIDWNK